MKTFNKLLFKSWRRCTSSKLSHATSGFTMIELLVASIVATLIITPLLGAVVSILNDDNREEIKASTEQDLQTAVDYIAEDVSQAIYVYNLEPTAPEEQTKVTLFLNELPESTNDKRNPVLVFLKRELVENAIPIAAENDDNKCTKNDNNCDDTYVISLVAYYLFEDKNDTWCKPDSDEANCPKRIVRFSVRDGVRKLNNDYICGADGRENCTDDDKKYKARDKGFNQNFDITEPLSWKKGAEDYENFAQDVLVNYIETFDVTEVENNRLAKIKISANALRRTESKANCDGEEGTAYCPTASFSVGGLSRLGE